MRTSKHSLHRSTLTFSVFASSKLALSNPHHMTANSTIITVSPFSNHFLSITTKSQVSFWWYYLGSFMCSPWTSNCGDSIRMLWRTGKDMNGKVNHMAWEYRRYFCHKIEKMNDGQRKTCFHCIILHLAGDEIKTQKGYVSWQCRSSDIESSRFCNYLSLILLFLWSMRFIGN